MTDGVERLGHAEDTGRRLTRIAAADSGIFLAPGLVILVIVAALSAYLTLESDKTAALGRQASELRVANLELISRIAHAETGQRGFLLTGDPANLVPYAQAAAQIPQMSKNLKELASTYPDRQALAERADQLVKAKLAEIQETIDLQKRGDSAGAIAIVRKNSGSRYFDELRSVLAQLADQLEAEVDSRRAEARAQRQWLVGASLAGLLLSTALSVIAVTRTRRQMGELRDRQQSLASVNEILEQRVAERTAELQHANAETERERDQIEALLADVNHRIGNNLQLVSSMLGLHARLAVGEEARNALHAARSQVQAIASAQRRLRLVGGSDEVEIGSFLEGLVQDFRDTLTEERPIAIEFSGGHAKVPSKIAVSIGVITNELINNAVKHAFADGEGGRIQVSLLASDDGRMEELVVADNGKGISKTAEGSGLGGRIVQTLSQSLNAVMTVEAANPGTRVRLDLREMDQPA